MGKVTGTEKMEELPEKVVALYRAVYQLIMEGEDMSRVKVSQITQKAGIGKGTAYDYFDSREEIIAYAIICLMRKLTEEIEQKLLELPDFADQVTFLLDKIEGELGKQQCFWRFLHLVLDTSGISTQVRAKLEQKHMDQYLPSVCLKTIFTQDQKRGQIKKEYPIDYVVYSVCAKMASYLACMNNRTFMKKDPRFLRAYIYRSILEEFSTF